MYQVGYSFWQFDPHNLVDSTLKCIYNVETLGANHASNYQKMGQ